MPQVDMKQSLELLTLLIGIGAFIYKLASLEHKLFTIIDNTGDAIFEKHTQLNQRLSIHIAECEQKQKNINYCLREIKNQLDKLNEKN